MAKKRWKTVLIYVAFIFLGLLWGVIEEFYMEPSNEEKLDEYISCGLEMNWCINDCYGNFACKEDCIQQRIICDKETLDQ
ncbi:hypothetical protein GF342_00250 [Candidatus Woesearchaeota archaeon]|nr:hypothetical protein [Candidatus Woesearchaeota archaeon]